MGNALLLSPAYGWFIGLLVVMIVVTALFALILFIALRPVKKEGYGADAATYADRLLGRREAELTSALLKNKNNLEEMEKLMVSLREVASAKKLINELVQNELGPQEPAKAKPAKPAKPTKQPPKQPAAEAAAASAAPAKVTKQPPQPAEPKKETAPKTEPKQEAPKAEPQAEPKQEAPKAEPANPAEAKPEAPASGENKE